MDDTVSTREAAIILVGWPNYSVVAWHARAGRLTPIRFSERKICYSRREVERLAKTLAKKYAPRPAA